MIEEKSNGMQEAPQVLLIKVEEAAKRLSLSRTMVYELIRVQGLPVHKFYSAVRISPSNWSNG